MPDMRFAPPPAMRMENRAGGLNQTSVRSYNEMLVLSLLRKHGSLSRMEIGQLSGLSAQTISVIVRALERDKLVLSGEAQRGRVGPPMIPMSLNGDGAFAIGVNVGPQRIDAVLVDFAGIARRKVQGTYASPRVAEVKAAFSAQFRELTAEMPDDLRARVIGLGVSLPENVTGWRSAEGDDAEAWRNFDFEAEFAQLTDLPTTIQNDVTAAAGAEVMFGAAREVEDFIYIFIATETEIRVVLNHRIYAGRGPARLLGKTRTGHGAEAGEPFAAASLTSLERALAAAGHDAAAIYRSPTAWPNFGSALDSWIDAGAHGLAEAVASIGVFVDVRTVIIGGRLPETTLKTVCESTQRHLGDMDLPSEKVPKIRPAELGAYAKAIGAASLPFSAKFMVAQFGLAPA